MQTTHTRRRDAFTGTSRMARVIRQAWHSPTFMTWGSHTARSLSLLAVMPLVLTRFATEEITLWYLFVTILSLQALADFGFVATFTRVIAYAMGGAKQLKDYREIVSVQSSGKPNWKTLAAITATMRAVYGKLTLILVALLGVIGTLAFWHPISRVEEQTVAWAAWGVILLTSAIYFRGNLFVAYLRGVNEIALLRRWEALTLLGAAATSVLVLLFNGDILALVLANQVWYLIRVVGNRQLSRSVQDGRFKEFHKTKVVPEVFASVWPAAWRSGLGVFMSRGLIEASGLIFAQLGSSAAVASYLIALRLIQALSMYSQAPFYTKLPTLARLRAEGRLEQQIQVAHRGMQYAYWTFVLGFITLGILAEPLLRLIGSNADFASPLLWSLMGLAFIVERYGAMHLQLYSTTNHIIWHIANGVSGFIYLLVSLLLFRIVGVYAFPIGILIGYLGFYAWYVAMHSYRAFNLNFWGFERSTSLVPTAALVAYILGVLLY